jgi:hypothetical protein
MPGILLKGVANLIDGRNMREVDQGIKKITLSPEKVFHFLQFAFISRSKN